MKLQNALFVFAIIFSLPLSIRGDAISPETAQVEGTTAERRAIIGEWSAQRQEKDSRLWDRSLTGKELHIMKLHMDGSFWHTVTFPDNGLMSPEHWTWDKNGSYTIKGRQVILLYSARPPQKQFRLILEIVRTENGISLIDDIKDEAGRRLARTFKKKEA